MDDPYRTTDATPPSGYPNADDTEPQTPSPAPWDAPTASDSTPAPYEPPTYEPPVFNAPWQSTPLPPAYTTPPSAPVYPPLPPTYTPPAYTAPPVYNPPSYNAPVYGPPPSQPLYTPNPSIPLAQPPMQPVPSQPIYGQPVYGQPIYGQPPVPQSGYLVPVPMPVAPHPYYAPPVVIVQQSDNSGLAIVLEVLGGLFGLFGIGWLIAGETTTGLLMLIGGFVWIGVAVVLSILTFGLFGFCLVPINLGAMITSAVMLNNRFKQKRMIMFR